MSTNVLDSSHIGITLGTETCSIEVDGRLDAISVARLTETLRLIPTPTSRILLRLSATTVGPGALVLLRHSLQQHVAAREATCQFFIWADEPLLRAALPKALLRPPTDPAGDNWLKALNRTRAAGHGDG